MQAESNKQRKLPETLLLHENYDAVIVGSGAAGLCAALGFIRSKAYEKLIEAGKRPSILVLSKLQALRSHTGSAEGGIAASLGNVTKDCWQWHYYDTVRGGDWLSDQDAAKILAFNALDTVVELEHDGVAFSRTLDGHINQRRFGGHTAHFGKEPIERAAYAADRIGHQILYSLWQQCVANNVSFIEECYVTDIAINKETHSVEGLVALHEPTGKLHEIKSSCILLATGGAGRIFATTSNSWDLTGDGMALALNAGLQIEDLEFVQFHPTGLSHTGILLSEAARGEGGILRNSLGEAFMKKYDPIHADLAPRDVVSRAIVAEVDAGRGIADINDNKSRKDCVWLDMTSISKEKILSVLPQVNETVQQYAHMDPTKDLIPIRPTAHYTMGGIPTTLNGEVYTWDGKNQTIINGLYAAGECSCVGVHGANRLGGNSLLDACVFGKLAGLNMAELLLKNCSSENKLDYHAETLKNTSKNRIDFLNNVLFENEKNCDNQKSDCNNSSYKTDGNENKELDSTKLLKDDDTNPYEILKNLENIMENAAAVRCSENTLKTALSVLKNQIIPKAKSLRAHTTSLVLNQELCAIMELNNMLTLSESLLVASLARHESRGSFNRLDYPRKDTENVPNHSFIDKSGNVINKPVKIVDFQPYEPVDDKFITKIDKIATRRSEE